MRILVADDDATTVAILKALLSSWDYEVVCASNGQEAWMLLRDEGDTIDIAIIDWMMPVMDGLEVCRLLKDTKRFPDTYAILLTCRQETEDVVTGLECGADDYISKPFSKAELRSRIEVGARMLRYERSLLKQQAELERYAGRMEELAETRAEQLACAERMSTLGVLAGGVARRLRPLLNKVATGLESGADEACSPGEELAAAMRLLEVLERFGIREDHVRRRCDVAESIRTALDLCGKALAGTFRLERDLPAEPLIIFACPQEIEQVFVNLFVNAVDATRDSDDPCLTVRARAEDSGVRVTLHDNGKGFRPDVLEHIWTPFFTTKPGGAGTGLGLAVVHAIVHRHRGHISAENGPDGGAKFTIWLPAPGAMAPKTGA